MQVRVLESASLVLLHYVLEPGLVNLLLGWHFLLHLFLSMREWPKIFPLLSRLVLGILTRHQKQRCSQREY